MANERLSNVVGAPFAEHVLTQLNLRAARNSTGTGNVPTRSPEEILFLANKMGWVKLTSSVRVVPDENTKLPITEFYKKLGLGEGYASSEDLAKNWILEAGTSKGNGSGINLRSGIGPEGAYGLGGIEELGYRPMPGLTGVTVDTKGTLGSLREATIQFKVWNMNQLNVIEALYFRLGYSMLLEWGHNQFFTNVNKQGQGGTFQTNTYGINPFLPNLRKEIIQQQIARRSYELSGNYDAMLGVVTNFQWSFNQEGGYDCTVRLVGLGAIIDSLKVNLSYKMPATLAETYKSQQELIADQQARLAELVAKDEEERKRKAADLPTLPSVPTNPQEIYTKIYTADLGTSKTPLTQDTFLANQALPTSYTADPINQSVSTVLDYFYQASRGGIKNSTVFTTELNQKRTGLFLSPIPNLRSIWTLLPTENIPPVTLAGGLLNLAATRASQPVQVRAKATVETADTKYINIQNKDLLGANPFTKAFDLEILNYRSSTFEGAVRNVFSGELKAEDPIYAQYTLINRNVEPITQTIAYVSTVVDPQTKQKVDKRFYITLTYIPAPLIDVSESSIAKDKLTRPTRGELIKALDLWINGSRKIQIDAITSQSNSAVVKGTINLEIPKKPTAVVTIEFNNTALIQTVLPTEQPQEVLPQNTQNANSGDTLGTDNTADNVQVDPAEKFASALHAMLAATKSQIQYTMGTKPKESVSIVDLSDLTKAFYTNSILDGIFNLQIDPNLSGFNLKQYALKGFNSNMMVDHSLYAKGEPGSALIPKVDFKKLSTGYGIRYIIQENEGKVNNPTYIKLGYLLAFLNSMCLVYDSTQDTDKHPYVYLDFNPETNFCLTVPQHLSIDPLTCMIPFNGTKQDYLKLFPASIAPNDNDQSIFNPGINAISSYLPTFKNNMYQGKTMEILLNIDFLLEKLTQFTTGNKEHTVNLKGFLDAVVDGVNKATGNLNLFRVAYRDDTNTVIIKDDQFVPPAANEAWMLKTSSEATNYDVPEGIPVPKYGQLPIFGKQSLVRELRFETDLSTNLSNVIAISGQSDTKAVNSTDHSSFSWLNKNFVDSYKPKISNSSSVTSKTNEKQKTVTQEEKTPVEHDLDQATQFNDHVKSIYYGGLNAKGEPNYLAKSKISFATNYYMNGIADIKSTNQITLAAPFIPANINITIDGIAGIVMGNAFTIPEDRLPLSLRGDGGINKNTKVGFVVVGLTHVIQNNQWLTKIRGQMIRLRDTTEYGIVQEVQRIQAALPTTIPSDLGAVSEADLSNINLNQDWIGIAFQFIASKESFRAQAYYDVNRYRGGYGSDILVLTPDANGKSKILSVTSSTVFTLADAKRSLDYNLIRFSKGVIEQIGQTRWEALNSRQKAALVSYVYNAGPGALRTWDIKRAIEINAPANQVAQLITRGPVTAGGKVLEGLITRRKEEAQLYLS